MRLVYELGQFFFSAPHPSSRFLKSLSFIYPSSLSPSMLIESRVAAHRTGLCAFKLLTTQTSLPEVRCGGWSEIGARVLSDFGGLRARQALHYSS